MAPSASRVLRISCCALLARLSHAALPKRHAVLGVHEEDLLLPLNASASSLAILRHTGAVGIVRREAGRQTLDDTAHPDQAQDVSTLPRNTSANITAKNSSQRHAVIRDTGAVGMVAQRAESGQQSADATGEPVDIDRASQHDFPELSRRAPAAEQAASVQESASSASWLVGLFLVFFTLAAIVCCCHAILAIKLPADQDGRMDIVAERCCPSLRAWACVAFALMGLAGLWQVSSVTSVWPTAADVADSALRAWAGQQAFIAGAGVAASIGVVSLWVLLWRWKHQTPVGTGRLALTALRGATFSVAASVVIESSGLSGRNSRPILGSNAWLAGAMLLVSVSEETSKAFAAAWMLDMLCRPTNLRKPGLVLLQSKRALALVGMAAGGGFMVTENAMYLVGSLTGSRMDDDVAGARQLSVLSLLVLIPG